MVALRKLEDHTGAVAESSAVSLPSVGTPVEGTVAPEAGTARHWAVEGKDTPDSRAGQEGPRPAVAGNPVGNSTGCSLCQKQQQG